MQNLMGLQVLFSVGKSLTSVNHNPGSALTTH
ncbi:Uncharacterised protein [Fluoribacter dumoffii]|uniref:Uncharacterized protein n=1 Tax=Fluoribacter dumoffii TaxID=463 RepID=A0A377GDN8_9GAMM|nr:Uncharacterised protein [Fluoribacter dumoffii]